MSSKCRTCSAPVVWIKRKQGNPIPCDPEIRFASPGGRDRLVTGSGEVVACTIGQFDLFSPATIEGRISHFATCPDAEEHRK